MEKDEKVFFIICYSMKIQGLGIREAIQAVSDTIPRERCIDLLRKWRRLGFYRCVQTIDLGVFVSDKFPPEYLAVLKDIYYELGKKYGG